jgi:hypothetical protein
MTKAFLAVQGNQGAASARVRELTESLTQQVAAALIRRMPAGGTLPGWAELFPPPAGLTRVACPWLLGPIQWDAAAVRKAVVWLSRRRG